MKKVMLTTLLTLMSNQSFAALTSHGSATTSMTLNAPTSWSITKGMDAEGTLGAGNIYTGDSIMDHAATIIIKNGSTTAGTYYIRGQGDSRGSNGDIVWVSTSNSAEKHLVPNLGVNLDSTWSAADDAYKSNNPLAAGAEQTFSFYGQDGDVFEPGVYTLSLELLTETP
ncbi:hypothetical protein Y71_26170 [Kosakonia radicincitans DSM 16656]|uniref:hypothetical protein n=1 Tax=Kosakonia TaxID=1330547 RepID=UPI0002730AEA|nr:MULTISPECIES: hypothetical protein [Kosakonia]NCF08605.1 hypothetical protein [Kosakonia sp. MH5]APG20789.1 hypothetical protein A3780_25715 [Kosakonia radicincitans]ARD63204.1 hypothetical protein Y71_26170 [Kosakonia radicincitans DSM 16656]PTA87323.1 hypothetical protein CWM66_26900 [Kosakonia sp. H7A]QEM93789.1 hypothetical protein FEI17_25675 [Kosakonia radicincitans]